MGITTAIHPDSSTRPLRVLHVTLGADAGGLSRYIMDLGTAMQRQGHFVAAAGDTGAWQGAFDAAPFPYLNIPLKGGPVKFFQSLRAVRKFCKEHRIDLLHTHYRRATQLARFVRLPVLYTLHLSHIDLSGVRRWLTDFGDHTHAASVDARQWLIDGAGLKTNRITLIPHGVDVARFTPATLDQRRLARQSLDLNETDRVAVFVGRLDTPKNEDWLLDLAGASRDVLPDLKILLVGEGPHEAQVKRRITSDRLGGRVRVLGERDPLPVYHAADALLLPSQREGFSLVSAEAMACGVPVLRTRTSGTTELIVENVTGRSVEIDHDAFIAQGISFLSDLTSLRQMGAHAAAHVREHFTFERQLDQTIALYRRLLVERGTR